MKKIAVFPGSFDPFTKGHEDIVLRALPLFDEIIIGLGVNSGKNRYFAVEQMLAYINTAFANEPKVRVLPYTGLTAEFARSMDAYFLLRGVRNTTDFEYENTLAQANKHVFAELETVFLITSPTLAAISSTIVRDLHKYGNDVSVFLPYKL